MPELNTPINNAVAAELRACAARKGLTGTRVADQLGVPKMWVSRRFIPAVEISVSDLVELSQVIGVEPLDVFAQALMALTPAPAVAGT